MRGLLHRRIGIAAAMATFLVIASATLVPAHITAPLSGPWCLVCGPQGTIDVVQNVLLFVPLGAALGWLGVRPRVVVAGAFALTLAIESLQYFVIPGRDGAVGDIVMNTIGAWIGAGLAVRRFWPLRPVPRTANRQYAVALLICVAALGLSPVALTPHTPRGPFMLVAPVVTANDTVHADVLSARVNAVTFPANQLVPSPALEPALSAPTSTMAMTVVPDRAPATYTTIARLVTRRSTAASFGQTGGDFVCARRMLASFARIRTPEFLLSDALPSAVPGTPPLAHDLECTRESGRVVMRSTNPADTVRGSVDLTPGIGWTLLIPRRISAHAARLRWSNVAFLAALLLPVGYYGFFARRGVSPATTQRRAVVVVIPLAAILFAQSLLPRFVHASPSPWWELAASCAGLAVGWTLGAVWSRIAGRLDIDRDSCSEATRHGD